MKRPVMTRNTQGDFILLEVEAKPCKFCPSAFIHKDDRGYYVMTDIASGLQILRTRRLKDLEEIWDDTSYEPTKHEKYDEARKSKKYQLNVERFEKLKLVAKYEEHL